jgi:prepilin-type N-terminal cleavage/methylation domain-containing protein
MPILIPGRSGLPRKKNKGITLIELLVAMAIVGAIFAAAATGLRSALGVNLKSSASRLASTLRYLSNKAVTDHMYLRVVFDLEGQSYHVEESQDPFVISPEEELAEEKEEKKEEEAPEGEEGEEAPKEAAGFAPSESRLLKPSKLPSDVFFKDVYISYLNQKKENGKAYTYFFPDGFATATLINLRDDDDEEHFAVEVLPLSGQVKVFGEYRESPTEEKK